MGDDAKRVIEEILKSNVVTSEQAKEAVALFRVHMVMKEISNRSAMPSALDVSLLRGIVVFRLEQIYNEMETASPYARKRKLLEGRELEH